MQQDNDGGSQQAFGSLPGSPNPDSGTPTSRRQFLALAGAGTAALVLARDSNGWAANRPGLRSFNSATVTDGVQQFHSRPDLLPPQVVIDRRSSGVLAGSIVTEVHGGASQSGPLIFDQHGRIIWFNPLSPQPSAEHRAFNVQVAKYDGKPVLAWFEGAVVAAHGQGAYQIVDTRYRPVAQVQAQGGYIGDLHEFVITPQGTALFTCYAPAQEQIRVRGRCRRSRTGTASSRRSTSPPASSCSSGAATNTSRLDYSYIASGARLGGDWDYFHINAITIDPVDQNLVISSRNTATLYKVNRKTGRVMWRMGGKHNQFHMGPGHALRVPTRRQNVARRRDDGVRQRGRATALWAAIPGAHARGR